MNATKRSQHPALQLDFPAYEAHVNALLADNAYRLRFGDDIPDAIALLEPLFDERNENQPIEDGDTAQSDEANGGGKRISWPNNNAPR